MRTEGIWVRLRGHHRVNTGQQGRGGVVCQLGLSPPGNPQDTHPSDPLTRTGGFPVGASGFWVCSGDAPALRAARLPAWKPCPSKSTWVGQISLLLVTRVSMEIKPENQGQDKC